MAGGRTTGPAAAGELSRSGGSKQACDQLPARFAGRVRWLAVTPHVDERGRLVEFDLAAVPFRVRRIFAVTDVPAGAVRGGHRHRSEVQVLFCLAGRVDVELSRGEVREELTLTPDTGGLYVASGVWTSQRYVNEGSELLVLSDEPYDPSTYDASH